MPSKEGESLLGKIEASHELVERDGGRDKRTEQEQEGKNKRGAKKGGFVLMFI